MQVFYCVSEVVDRFQGQTNACLAHERSLTLFKVTAWNMAAPTELPNQQQRCAAGNGSKQLFLKPLLHCGQCITNILAQRHPFHVLDGLFLVKVSPRLVFYTRMVAVTADKSSLMAKNTVVSDALPDSTLWRFRMFVLVGKRKIGRAHV